MSPAQMGMAVYGKRSLATPTIYHFRVAGTGHDLGSNVGRHIGSFQMHGGALVFHVFADGVEQKGGAA